MAGAIFPIGVALSPRSILEGEAGVGDEVRRILRELMPISERDRRCKSPGKRGDTNGSSSMKSEEEVGMMAEHGQG